MNQVNSHNDPGHDNSAINIIVVIIIIIKHMALNVIAGLRDSPVAGSIITKRYLGIFQLF